VKVGKEATAHLIKATDEESANTIRKADALGKHYVGLFVIISPFFFFFYN
jgi:hypothetical protein